MKRDSSDARNAMAEALALHSDTVTTACLYCMVMLGDVVNAKKTADQARPELEVFNVAQLLVRSVKLRGQTAQAAAQKEEGAGL